eukprot:CAMPEP_0185589354 /NCGR_PEP_ID=MMETSP0434-20130131/56729_1 /TAXON_ID=626734 ORGANISM="Favella taraikaensis, Strain Fe Narragansett Bay" /NCGR_SAMPLE_ID=MMETSP0434 /ASSEMBLY_ACC=CAM_ASM_000379 /LENGTH=84 /DNA_ID=CAMNT_0028212691 /DNA_START=540 /DNA_END=791 /DNA_ORIENTATION=+
MAETCEPCQQNAECDKEGQASPNEGFVLMHQKSYLPTRCFNKHACSGPIDPVTYNRTCTDGYAGIMCAFCDELGDGPHYWKNPG